MTIPVWMFLAIFFGMLIVWCVLSAISHACDMVDKKNQRDFDKARRYKKTP